MADNKTPAPTPAEPVADTSNADSRGYHGESAADRGNPARPEDTAPFGGVPTT